MTTANKRGARFERGTGAYACRVCKRLTRSTGRGDNENCQLCAECFDLAGESNHLSDNGELYDAFSVRAALISLTAKGIDAEALFPDVVAALAKQPQV